MRIYSDRKEAIGLNKIIVEMSPEMYTQEEFEAFVSVLAVVFGGQLRPPEAVAGFGEGL